MIDLALLDLEIFTDKIGKEVERLRFRLDWDYSRIAKFLIKK